MSILSSVEHAPGRQELVGGVLKRVREPVLVLVEPVRAGAHLSCAWVFTHAGLVAGDYELSDGSTVSIPKGLCGDSAQARQGVTLEVRDE